MKQPLDHGDIDAIQHFVPMMTPITDEVVDDFGTEVEGGVMESRWSTLDHVAVGEGDGADA